MSNEQAYIERLKASPTPSCRRLKISPQLEQCRFESEDLHPVHRIFSRCRHCSILHFDGSTSQSVWTVQIPGDRLVKSGCHLNKQKIRKAKRCASSTRVILHDTFGTQIGDHKGTPGRRHSDHTQYN